MTVELIVKHGEADQVTILEEMLIHANIDYTLASSEYDFGLGFPFLYVNGVPLDLEHASKWIEEMVANE